MSAVEARLKELGPTLPRPMAPPPGTEYRFALVRVSARHAHISGHPPADGHHYPARGKLGRDLSVEEGHDAARLSALSMLASLKHTLGDLDRIAGWARAVGYVNCTPDFADTFLVVNGFSHLILQLSGKPGRHARAAPGVPALPLNVPVVVEATVELRQ
jgi:enamine deaminase RidA (YjgF/YER057c/UK114 family)